MTDRERLEAIYAQAMQHAVRESDPGILEVALAAVKAMGATEAGDKPADAGGASPPTQ